MDAQTVHARDYPQHDQPARVRGGRAALRCPSERDTMSFPISATVTVVGTFDAHDYESIELVRDLLADIAKRSLDDVLNVSGDKVTLEMSHSTSHGMGAHR